MTSFFPLTLTGLLRTLGGQPACRRVPAHPTPSVSPVLRGGTTASALELTLVIAVVATMTYLYMPQQKQATDNLQWAATADQLRMVSDAAKRYIRDNETSLLQTVTAGHPLTVSGRTLQDSGYIPAGFALTNLSGQTWELGIALNPKQSGKLVAFVLSSGGKPLTFAGMRTVSADTGGMAGYIDTANVATGAWGGWEVDLRDYGLSAAPGHLAMYLTSDALGNSNSASDRLYRYTVSNRPDLNTMHTAINMGANNLNNVGTVNTQAMTASGALQSDSLTTRALSANTITASTSITTQDLTANNRINTGALNAGNITTSGNIAAGGTVNGAAVTSTGTMTANGTITSASTVRANGRLSGGEYLQLDAVATAGAGCSPNGLIGHDSTGAILSCQSGVWSQGKTQLQRTQWTLTGGNNYGDQCGAYVNSSGMSAQGWVATGADACSEDLAACTVDNVVCTAVRLQ